MKKLWLVAGIFAGTLLTGNIQWLDRPLIQSTTEAEEYADAVHLNAFLMPLCNEESLYENTQRCIVRVNAGQYSGSGIIWKFTKDGMIVVSNRHLLMHDVKWDVILGNGDILHCEVLGLSQQYDIGFLFIQADNIPDYIWSELLEARKQNDVMAVKNSDRVWQIGVQTEGVKNCYEGMIEDYIYVPEFGTQMLRTQCYAKAGMSGGGVFDREGWLLGMITGGEASDSGLKETQLTYSIPTSLIEEEYQIVISENE